MPSFYEGFPNALIEAMSVPLTCVSSDCVAGPREIINHGKNGFLFQNNNLQDFLIKFEEFKKADSNQLENKKKNLKKYIKKFTLYSHFNSLNKIIKFEIA